MEHMIEGEARNCHEWAGEKGDKELDGEGVCVCVSVCLRGEGVGGLQ